MRAYVWCLAFVLAVAGCTEASDDWDVPSDGPHEAYVDRVLSELAEVHADTLDDFAERRQIDERIIARLEATFTEEEAGHRRAGLENVLANDLEGFAGTEGPRPIAVRSLPGITGECVIAETDVALPTGAGAIQAPAEASVVVELHRADVEEATNPTGWVIAREELVPDGNAESVSGCS